MNISPVSDPLLSSSVISFEYISLVVSSSISFGKYYCAGLAEGSVGGTWHSDSRSLGFREVRDENIWRGRWIVGVFVHIDRFLLLCSVNFERRISEVGSGRSIDTPFWAGISRAGLV